MQIILTFKDNCIILNILFLELTFLEHLLLLLSDAFQQYLCWFIIWILRNKFATDSKIKYFLS